MLKNFVISDMKGRKAHSKKALRRSIRNGGGNSNLWCSALAFCLYTRCNLQSTTSLHLESTAMFQYFPQFYHSMYFTFSLLFSSCMELLTAFV